MRYWFAPAEVEPEKQGARHCEAYCQKGCIAREAAECRLSREPEVLEENAIAWGLFRRYQTQWHAGMGGFYGLNYEFFMKLLGEYGVTGAEQIDIIDRLNTIEGAYLIEYVQAQREIDREKGEEK